MELKLLYNRVRDAGIAFIFVLIIGSIGYKLLATYPVSLFDGLYMTIITVSTIGFEEVVDVTGNVPGRILTIFLAFSGVGLLTFILSNFAALLIEGDLREKLRINKMEKTIENLKNHYIICGFGLVGYQTAAEFNRTHREFVYSDQLLEKVLPYREELDEFGIGMVGDCTEDDFLLKLGIKNATGLIITTSEDNIGLMICLTAKQLNPNIRIIARCSNKKNARKYKSVGAEKVISPSFIGGLRIASEMVRPTVTSFLDKMLRGSNPNLRIEEITFSQKYIGKNLREIPIDSFKDTLILAIKEGENWTYNPDRLYAIKDNSILVVMTSPDDRIKLINQFSDV